ncbi:COMM domain-containing protein 4 [Melitaea cinxia]|uniref:COMM domain-containing protein 4 n=1 Tax=Melitaea cinxia TaxID=113334 RepID=UPI001E270090|nr:COMM domain-containing protein 4 [Melitaea cinxia]
MKFKFCSDGDCPLWALAALHALSSLPIPIFRNLLQHVVEEHPDDGIMEILKDTNLSSREECARAAAVLRWTLKQAHRCGCSGVQLARDLLVLGVPRAHASALADAAESGREAYEAQIKNTGFMINKLTDVTAAPGPEGTVDTIKLTLHIDEVFTGEQKTDELIIDKSQAKVLLEEMKKALKRMEEIDI